MENDAALVRRVLNGQTDAYAELVRRHERALLAAAGAVLGELHGAQDAVQESLVIAHQRLGSLRNADAFGQWTIRIVHRVALGMRRRRDRAGPLAEDVEARPPSRDSRLDDEIQRLFQAVLKLPEKQRQAVLLRYFSGHSIDTISGLTAQPAGTVRSHLSRGLARLRERLEDLDHDAGR
jgi:RNA polymerase sigma-70 factor (ECF subfamily)